MTNRKRRNQSHPTASEQILAELTAVAEDGRRKANKAKAFARTLRRMDALQAFRKLKTHKFVN